MQQDACSNITGFSCPFVGDRCDDGGLTRVPGKDTILFMRTEAGGKLQRRNIWHKADSPSFGRRTVPQGGEFLGSTPIPKSGGRLDAVCMRGSLLRDRRGFRLCPAIVERTHYKAAKLIPETLRNVGTHVLCSGHWIVRASHVGPQTVCMTTTSQDLPTHDRRVYGNCLARPSEETIQ